MRYFVLLFLSLALTSNATADLVDRWTTTATNGSGINRGDPVTLTWGFVADGTSITGTREGTSPSNLISFLDANLGTGMGTDLTMRPWFINFQSSFDRWSQLSGLTFNYVSYDGGAPIDNTTNPSGLLGTYADIRIGGHSIDGQSGSNILAYNYYPNHGDMVIDTDNSGFYSNSNNSFVGLRNTVMHELGHGLGLDHRRSLAAGDDYLMEPFINTAFDGPQFDDIWSIQRGYGDALEKGGGNDTFSTATDLGTLNNGDTVVVGDHASDMQVLSTETDFVSIDGGANFLDPDTDFFRISVNEAGVLDLVLTPQGPTYLKAEQMPDGSFGPESMFDASAQSDLMLELLLGDGVTSLASSNATGLGGQESITGFVIGPGTYFARISGLQDATQLYRFSASFLVAVPEPTSLGLAMLGAVLLLRHRSPRTRLSTR